MKTYEEFVTIDSAEVLKTGITTQLDRVINKLMQPKMVLVQLLGEVTVAKGHDTHTLRREIARMVAEDFNEDADIPDIGIADRWDTIVVTPAYFGGGNALTGQAIGDADFDLVRDQLQGIADAMAIKADARVLEELLQTAVVTAEAIAGGGTEFDLAHGENSDPGSAILAVTDVSTTNPATWELDYLNGHIKFSVDPGASTIDYIWSDGLTYQRAATPGVVSYNDLVNMKTNLRSEFVTADSLVVDKNSEGALLKDDKFIHATQMGDRVIMRGQIGMASGMDVLSNDTTYDDVPFVCLRGDRLGKVVYKEKTTSRIDTPDKRPNDRWVQAWQKSNPGITRPNWIVVLINGQINAYDE